MGKKVQKEQEADRLGAAVYAHVPELREAGEGIAIGLVEMLGK